jgi:tetratricopeptide (TPR) repeat protein
MRSLAVIILIGLSPGGNPTTVSGQARPSPPALIRDTDKAEGKDEADATKPKDYNPLEAERNVRIGDFYVKRKNYTAAIQRYRDAVDYQPNLIKAYDALGRAYEKTGAIDKAKEVYREFIQKNPDSAKVPEFHVRLAKLEKPSN